MVYLWLTAAFLRLSCKSMASGENLMAAPDLLCASVLEHGGNMMYLNATDESGQVGKDLKIQVRSNIEREWYRRRR